jgi:ribosomal protein S27E
METLGRILLEPDDGEAVVDDPGLVAQDPPAAAAPELEELVDAGVEFMVAGDGRDPPARAPVMQIRSGFRAFTRSTMRRRRFMEVKFPRCRSESCTMVKPSISGVKPRMGILISRREGGKAAFTREKALITKTRARAPWTSSRRWCGKARERDISARKTARAMAMTPSQTEPTSSRGRTLMRRLKNSAAIKDRAPAASIHFRARRCPVVKPRPEARRQ